MGSSANDISFFNTKKPLLPAGNGRGGNGSKRRVEFYLQKSPYPKTWATLVVKDFDPNADGDVEQEVVYETQIVFDNSIDFDKLPRAHRFHRTMIFMTSKCNLEYVIQQLSKQCVQYRHRLFVAASQINEALALATSNKNLM